MKSRRFCIDSVPAIAGATLYKFKDVSADSVDWTAVGVGTGVSMIGGYRPCVAGAFGAQWSI